MVTKQEALHLGRRLKVDFTKIPFAQFRKGIDHEAEHDKGGALDVLPGRRNLLGRAKIALAHLQEYPDYYTRLARAEGRRPTRDRCESVSDRMHALLVLVG